MNVYAQVSRAYLEDVLEKYRILYQDVIISKLIPKLKKLTNEKRETERVLWFFKKLPVYHSCEYYSYLLPYAEKLVWDMEESIETDLYEDIHTLLCVECDSYLIGTDTIRDIDWLNFLFQEYQLFQKEQSRKLAEVLFNAPTEEDHGDTSIETNQHNGVRDAEQSEDSSHERV